MGLLFETLAKGSVFKWTCLALCWLSVHCLLPSLNAWQFTHGRGEIPFTSFGPEEHSGTSYSAEIAEDSRGNIYIGNEAGVLRFDGRDWSMLPPTGHRPLEVALHIDADDRIWVGGIDHLGYYQANKNGELHFNDLSESLFRILDGENHGMIWSIFSHNNLLYFVTSFHVLILDGIEWKRYDFDVDRRILPTWLNNQLYIHARSDGLYRLSGKQIEKILPEHQSISSGIMNVLSADQDTLRLGTLGNGVWKANGGLLKKETGHSSAPELALSYLELDKGRLLVGRAIGLFMVKEDGEEVQINKDKIASVYRSYKSSNGTIWITSNRSIYRIPPSTHIRYGQVTNDLTRHQDEIFVLSDAKINKLAQSGEAAIATGWLSNPLSLGPYLVYTENNVIHVNQNGKRQFSTPLKRPCTIISKSILNNSFFYSMDEPGISRWKVDASGISLLSRTVESKKIFSSLAEINADTSLYTTSHLETGLIHWPASHERGAEPSLEVLELDASAPQDSQYMTAIQVGNRAVLATDKGIFAFNPKDRKFTRLNLLTGILGRTWNDFVHCPSSNGERAVVYIKDQNREQGYRLGILHYEDQAGFKWDPLQLKGIDEVGAVNSLLHEEREGREYLWVGGSKDLFRYDITDPESPPVLQVNLTSIAESSESKTYYAGFGPPPKIANWPYPQKSLRVGYAAPPSALKAKGYQSRLIGFSDKWSKLAELPFREFNNLREGKYTFEVRAIDEFGRPGPSTSFAFTILPPWHRTPYAYLGYVVFGICVVLIVAHLWAQHLRRRNIELEAMVNQRTSELERSNQKLREANSVKQNFLASMSHEIRNPLNGILGIAQLLKQEQTEKTTRVSHLNACATHLHQLLGQVLDYSSLESGKLETRPLPFDTNKLINEVIEMHQVLAEKKGLTIKLDTRKTEYLWIGDPVLLRQVLINLVSNAIKYTPSGVIQMRLDFENQNESLQARFIVEDTGPGIPEDKREYIFKDFTRLTKAGESEVAGTGLGLAISKHMAEMMHGTLRVDDDYVDGARFVLELPFDLGGKIHTEKNAEGQDNSRPLEGKHILVADDMDFNRYICRELLEKFGARVAEVEDGQHALEALREERFDIAILDINMPKMDGNQVVRTFLSSHIGSPPLFIALTAHVTAQMEREAREAGFQQFVEKPLDQHQIIHIALAQPLREKEANAPDLLSYLAGKDMGSKSRLQARYLKSIHEQLEALRTCLEEKDFESAKAILHKVRGLANMQRRTDVMETIDALSISLAEGAATESAHEQLEKLEAGLKEA